MPDGRLLQQRQYHTAAAAATAPAWRPASFTQVMRSVSPAYQLRQMAASRTSHIHHQEHVMTNDDPKAGSTSGTTSHVNHVHGNNHVDNQEGDHHEDDYDGSRDVALTPGMDWDGDEQPQHQQQPISASMLMLHYHNTPGGLPTGRDHLPSTSSQRQDFFSSNSQQQQHPMYLHNPHTSTYHPGHLLPRPPGVVAANVVPGSSFMGAASIPVEATHGVSARAVGAHGEALGAPIPASERQPQQQPAAYDPALFSPAGAFPAAFQPRGLAVSSAAAAGMRPMVGVGSGAGGGGAAASVNATTAVFQLPNFQLPGFQLPGRPRPPPPVITHTWSGRTLPQPAALACSPAATAGIPMRFVQTAAPDIGSFEDDAVSASSSFPYPGDVGFGGNTIVTASGGGAASGRGGSVGAVAAAAVAATAAATATTADVTAAATAADTAACVMAAVYGSAVPPAPQAGVAFASCGGAMEMDSHHAGDADSCDDSDSAAPARASGQHSRSQDGSDT
ncbi:unnamed protein product [Closterium sp. NIES-53]